MKSLPYLIAGLLFSAMASQSSGCSALLCPHSELQTGTFIKSDRASDLDAPDYRVTIAPTFDQVQEAFALDGKRYARTYRVVKREHVE